MKYFKYLIIALPLLLVGLVLMYVSDDLPADYLEQKYSDEHSQFMDVAGIRTHYKVEGSGPILLLIHGTAASLHTWDDWVQSLAEHFTLIRLDIPAFGLTGATQERDYSIDFYTRYLDAFVTKLNIEKFSLAGNSLGGRIAWNYVVKNPTSVEKLILIDAAGIPGNPVPDVIKLAQTSIGALILRHISSRWFIQKNLEQVYTNDSKISEQLIDRYWEMGLRVGGRQAFIDRANAHLDTDIELLQSIDIPTLVMWGRDDIWIPVENAYEFDQRIPNSTLIIYDQVGHVPMEEIPLITANDALQFLQGEEPVKSGQ